MSGPNDLRGTSAGPSEPEGATAGQGVEPAQATDNNVRPLLSDTLLQRIKRVDPTIATRYRQKAGQ
jgi:hypothetical protein